MQPAKQKCTNKLEPLKLNKMLNFFLLLTSLQAAPLIASEPIEIPGGPGHFDFMNIDQKNKLVIACHPAKNSLAIFDIAANEAFDVPVGAACNGSCANSKEKVIYAAGPGKTIVVLDETTWKVTDTVAVDGPGDCVQYDSGNHVVYVDNDDGTKVWIMDAASKKLSGEFTIKEAPEYMEFDKDKQCIYQAIKSASVVQVLDVKTKQVAKEYTLGGLTSPHGLCLDRKARRLYVVGKNGKLAILDADSGSLIKEVDVLKNSDQVAMDAAMHRVYIPSSGKIQVVDVSNDAGAILGEVAVNKDCRRVTVDKSTHDVYVAFTDDKASYFQKFSVAKQ